MTRTKYFLVLVLLVLFSSVMVLSQQREATHESMHASGLSDTGCVLSTATDGQIITVHGKVFSEPHDMSFAIPGCNETVLLTYAGDQDNYVSADQLQKDENLKQFQNYTSAMYKNSKKNLCMQCMKYGDVEATLTGKLEIATMPPDTTKDPSGFLRDSSGKIVGKFGWGHPVPFARYRLVIQSVSDVKARKLPKPTQTKTRAQTNGKTSVNKERLQPVVTHTDLPLPPIARAAGISRMISRAKSGAGQCGSSVRNARDFESANGMTAIQHSKQKPPCMALRQCRRGDFTVLGGFQPRSRVVRIRRALPPQPAWIGPFGLFKI